MKAATAFSRALTALAAVGFALACASSTPPVDAGPGMAKPKAGSPWEGLVAAEAVDRLLELAIPYDMSNAHLVDSLAESYDDALVPALVLKLDATPPAGDEPDLARFLLVRTGCRWLYRQRGEDRFEPARAQLLERMDDALAQLAGASYYDWLNGLEEDRACVQEILAVSSL